jgi:DNA segregation ATPase FtsK/SpoIIIE, S-DNA-T family
MTDKTRIGTPDSNDPDDAVLATVVQFPGATTDGFASTGDVIDADTDDKADAGRDADGEDHEAVVVPFQRKGPPVDPPDESKPLMGGRRQRRPIVPNWLRSKKNALAAARWTISQAAYGLAFHGMRLPKYLIKVAIFAPVGLGRTVARLVRWAMAEEGNFALRQMAAAQDDAQGWLRLDMQRERQSRWRWSLLLAAVAGVVIVLVIASNVLPDWSWWLVLGAVVAVFGRLGRPADRPITDRVTEGQTYRKLTAELVRRALLSVQLGAINSAVAKDPNAITFPMEIHRDGPGHLAIVDLPFGVEAGDVCARRGRLASGLRLPLDQVWPEPAPGHTGRLALWVGHEPASQMRQPAWPLIRDGAVDVFEVPPGKWTPS